MVIAILAVLIGLLLPAVQKIRASASRLQCQNSLKQIGLAIHSYEDSYKEFPAGVEATDRNDVWLNKRNWAITILPFLEQESLSRNYDNDVLNYDPANADVLGTPLPVMFCPDDPRNRQLVLLSAAWSDTDYQSPVAPGSYKGVSGRISRIYGLELYWDYAGYLQITQQDRSSRGPLQASGVETIGVEKIATIRDGLSNTFLVGEYVTLTNPEAGAFWGMSGVGLKILGTCFAFPELRGLPDYDQCVAIQGGRRNRCNRAFASVHPGQGMNFVYCDGRVVWTSSFIDSEIWQGLATVSNGQVVANFD